MVDSSYTESNYALSLDNKNIHIENSSKKLNDIIKNVANKQNIKYFEGTTLCNECFDPYIPDIKTMLSRVPKDITISGCEMEAFALFYVAKVLNKKASCIMSVVDSKYIKEVATPEERQTGLTNMIKLALDSSLKITD